MDNKRTRKPRRLGRLALMGTAAWMAYAAFQKNQALKARRSSSFMPVAPELSRSAMIDGILMRWEEHGTRDPAQPPVIMVHGIPTNPRIWRYVIPHLTGTGVYCLAWELVGFGWSINEGLGRDISISQQAEYLAAWLRAQGIERAVFVGHDVGGGVVQALLAARPELFAGLVLVDSVAFDNWPVAAMKTARQFNRVIDKLPPAMLKPIFHAGLAELGHDDARRGVESAALLWAPYAQPTGAAGFANQARHMSARDTLAAAARLPNRDDLPVRIVWGEEDPLDIASAERLATLLSAPPVRRILGGRHFNPEDHPDIVADEIRAVLGSVTTSTAAMPAV